MQSHKTEIYSIHDQTIKLAILIKPQAKNSAVLGLFNNRLKIAVAATPVDGKANKELIKFIANMLNIKRQDIIIASGEYSPLKLIHLPIIVKDKIDKILFNLQSG